MIPKLTENTITTLLAEELSRLGVKASPFASISTPSGRREVDIWCENGGTYPIEAKHSERDLVDALSKIWNEYLRYRRELAISGGFVILYPQDLVRPLPIDKVKELAYKFKFRLICVFPPEDVRRNFTQHAGNIREIAQVLADYILRPPEYVEPDVQYIIKALRDGAVCLKEGLVHMSEAQLEGLFGGRHVFENILQYEKREIPVEDLRFGAAYLLLNQLLFYHVLSKKRDLPEIDELRLRSPVDLRQYFDRVLDINYKPIFRFDVASSIPIGYLSVIRRIISAIKVINPEKIGGDLLGTIFHDLVPFEIRKPIAAYYTNMLAAELLAWLSIDRWDAKVADLACGSGGLLVAAYRRKKALLKRERAFQQKDHRRFVEEDLLGIDVMPFAANVAACHLSLQAPQYPTNKVRIAVWDSTDLAPGMKIPSIASLRMVFKGQTSLLIEDEKEEIKKGVVSLTEEEPREIGLNHQDVVIMNPPFTRQERIPENYKNALLTRFREYNEYLHGQLGYSGYFILLADKFLKENGRMALVLPATILRVRSCEGIRRFWAENYCIEHIITTWYRSAFSESVRFREILVVARKSEPSSDAKVKITFLKELPKTLVEAREMADFIKNIQQNTESDKMIVRLHNYSDLRKDTSNWFKYIAVSNPDLMELFKELSKSDKLVRLSSVGDIIRGYELRKGLVTKLIINSKEERAIKSGDIWILLEEDEEFLKFRHKTKWVAFKISKDFVRRTLRRAAGLSKIDTTEELDYIIIEKFGRKHFNQFQKIAEIEISSELMDSIKNDVNRRLGNLFIVRRLDLSAPRSCNLTFYSSTEAAPTKLFWSLMTSDEDAKILALYLNSTINLLQVLLQRAETRGAFIELSGYILADFLVIDPQKLSPNEKKYLLKIFDNIKNVEFPSLLEQLEKKNPARKLIDKAFLDILGYKEDVELLLDRLYKSLAKEIRLLKELMAEEA